MRHFVQAVLALSVGLFLASSADAQWKKDGARRSDGFELMGGGGLNMCRDSGEDKCDKIDSSAAIFLAAGYRISANVGLYLDFNYGWLAPESPDEYPDMDITMTTMYVMPTVRVFTGGQGWELFGGLGAGYVSLKTEAEYEGESGYGSWSSWSGMKIEAGAGFEVAPNFFLGAAIDYVFNSDDTGEVCSKLPRQDEICEDLDGDVIDLLQLIAFAKVRF